MSQLGPKTVIIKGSDASGIFNVNGASFKLIEVTLTGGDVGVDVLHGSLLATSCVVGYCSYGVTVGINSTATLDDCSIDHNVFGVSVQRSNCGMTNARSIKIIKDLIVVLGTASVIFVGFLSILL